MYSSSASALYDGAKGCCSILGWFLFSKLGASTFFIAAVLRILTDFYLICRAKSLILFVCLALRRTLDLLIGVRIPASQPNSFLIFYLQSLTRPHLLVSVILKKQTPSIFLLVSTLN